MPCERLGREPLAAPSRLTESPATDGGPGRLRSFRREDIPEVAALRQQVFRFSERERTERLVAYLEHIFYAHPWAQDDLPSLVYEDERGRVAGFLGVIPRPLLFQGAPIRAAVATQLMVAPESRGLVGRRLIRAFLAGPQDLSLSDTANDAARLLWESLGGSVSVTHSLSWTRALRPCRHYASRASSGGPARRAAWLAARPVLAVADALATRLVQQAPPGSTEPLDAAVMAATLPRLVGPRALRPVYEDGSLGWLLEQAADKRQFGELRQRLVRGPGGEVVGWFLYYRDGGGVGQVLQVAAARSGLALVLRHLFYDAWRGGLTAVAGRLEPAWAAELGAQRCRFERTGPWVLIHARRTEILHAIVCGDAFVSRLEGEWWLSF